MQYQTWNSLQSLQILQITACRSSAFQCPNCHSERSDPAFAIFSANSFILVSFMVSYGVIGCHMVSYIHPGVIAQWHSCLWVKFSQITNWSNNMWLQWIFFHNLHLPRRSCQCAVNAPPLQLWIKNKLQNVLRWIAGWGEKNVKCWAAPCTKCERPNISYPHSSVHRAKKAKPPSFSRKSPANPIWYCCSVRLLIAVVAGAVDGV